MFKNKYDYDVLVIGGGAAGMTSAKTLRGFGKKVAIVEKNKLGGECTWSGCIPSKTIINVANLIRSTQKLSAFGADVSKLEVDDKKVMAHVRATVKSVYETHTPEKFKANGIDVIIGDPSFVDTHVLLVGSKKITAKRFIICTGSRPFIPPIPGLDTVDYLTNENLFLLETLPASMTILGGGSIGCEMASALNRLGVVVSIVEMAGQILSKEDHEMSNMVAECLKKENVNILTSVKATQIKKGAEGIVVVCEDKDGKTTEVASESLLVATGRSPNIETLRLDTVGVKTDKRGVLVDRYLRTVTSHIYACGDVVGPYLFSHVAWYQGMTVARNCFLPFFKKKVSYKNVLWVTFTNPELASAGLTEKAARKKYKTIRVYKHEYKDIDRGRTDGVTKGLCKVICDYRGRIIGAHICGPRAGELVHELQVGRAINSRFYKFAMIMHAYPSYSELIWHTAKKAYVDLFDRNIFVRTIKRIMGL